MKDAAHMCVHACGARDKGISAQGVICVSLKFIMSSDSWRSEEEEGEPLVCIIPSEKQSFHD